MSPFTLNKTGWTNVFRAPGGKSQQAASNRLVQTQYSHPVPYETDILNHSIVSEWVKSLSRVWLFATPWTSAYQASPSMGFSRQEYWSGLPFPSPGDLPDPGIEPGSPTLEADALTSEPQGSPNHSISSSQIWHFATSIIWPPKSILKLISDSARKLNTAKYQFFFLLFLQTSICKRGISRTQLLNISGNNCCCLVLQSC